MLQPGTVDKLAAEKYHHELQDHKIDFFNRDNVMVTAVDEPSNGGASHLYRVHLNLADNATLELTDIQFQKGPVNEVGVNGLSSAALLAIVLDQLRGFQRGPASCRENAIVTTKLEESLMWLRARSEDRERRQVEGTSAK